jgi:outer membrane protein TolC
MAAVLGTLFRNGDVSFDEVLEAKLLVLKAELEIAEKQSDRIALYQNIVDELQQYEQWAAAQVQSGRGTPASLLKIKARRLEAEIRLEQAKVKETQESK